MKGTRQRSEWFYKAVVHAALLLAWLGPAPQARAQLPDPNQGPGGPILVITSSIPLTANTMRRSCAPKDSMNSL